MAFYQVANTPESVTGHICIFMIIQAKRAAKGSIQYGTKILECQNRPKEVF